MAVKAERERERERERELSFIICVHLQPIILVTFCCVLCTDLLYMTLFICSVPQAETSADVTNCLVYLDNYICYAGLSRKVMSIL